MLFSSPVYSKASGSIAGITYSHNKGGMYARARVTPTDPSSALQQAVRSQFTGASQIWSNALTAAQRSDWSVYAANVAMTNRLGETIFLTGQQHYIRAMVPRIQAGVSALLAAPTTFNLGTYTTPTITVAQDDDDVGIGFTNTDDWATADGGYAYVLLGVPQDGTINYFRGPFNYAGSIPGATAIPPTSPATMTSPWSLTIGQRVWAQVRIQQVDGRLSAPIILGPETVVAAP